MFRSWKLGRPFGIGVYIHWTFLLLLGFVLLSNWGHYGLHSAVYAVSLLVSVFGCVVLHELGHALMARHFGIPTRDITLYPIGGVARLERMSEHPMEELCIALAGPAVNVVIAFLLFAVLVLAGPAPYGALESAAYLQGNFLLMLAWTNLGLALFNLLPAFPMDGGRVLRALLVPVLGRLRATQAAANVGSAFALLLVLGGFWFNPMLLLVGAFIFLAGRHELWATRRQAYARQAEPLDVIPVGHPIVDVGSGPAAPQTWAPSWDAKARGWVIWTNGQGVHFYRIQ
jgi:Zn-dependent protease